MRGLTSVSSLSSSSLALWPSSLPIFLGVTTSACVWSRTSWPAPASAGVRTSGKRPTWSLRYLSPRHVAVQWECKKEVHDGRKEIVTLSASASSLTNAYSSHLCGLNIVKTGVDEMWYLSCLGSKCKKSCCYFQKPDGVCEPQGQTWKKAFLPEPHSLIH